MKKLLSIALSAAMLVTTFSGLATLSANAEEAAAPVTATTSSKPETVVVKDFSTADSVNGLNGYIFDDTTFGQSCAKVNMAGTDVFGRPGATVDLIPNASDLDYNTKYKVRITARFTGAETDAFRMIFKQVGEIDGQTVNAYRAANGPDDFCLLGDIWGSATVDTAKGFSEYVCEQTIMPYGSNYRLWFFASGVPENSADAGIYIKKVELVPVESSIINGGKVRATGKQEGTNSTIYTATPDAGYTVENITAEGTATDGSIIVNRISVIDEVDGAVSFVVDPTEDKRIATNFGNFDARYLTVTFDKAENNSVVIDEFDTLSNRVANWGTRTIDTTDPYSGSGSLKVDLSQGNNNGWLGLNFYPNMGALDVNQKYRLKVVLRSDSAPELNSIVKFYGTVDGTEVPAKWNIRNADDFVLFPPQGADNVKTRVIGTEWTEYLSDETVQPFGNNFRINILLTTGTNTGNLWIDRLELVPADDGIDDGVVRVTGCNAETNSTIYTAYANDGYTVDDIVATVYADGNSVPKYLTVTERSRSADNKTVEFEVSGIGENRIVTHGNKWWGHHEYFEFFDARYITVNFGSAEPIIKTFEDEYIVSDFEDDAPDRYGNATPIYSETDTGKCYSTDAATDEISFWLDANTINKFDALTGYRLKAKIQSDIDWEGAIRVGVYSYFNDRKVSVLSDMYAGEYKFWADYDGGVGANADSLFGWTDITTYNNDSEGITHMFPIAGQAVKITLQIKRTSETGTVYLDDIALIANSRTKNLYVADDYSTRHGFVKTRYDGVNEQLIVTPVAAEGYVANNDLKVNLRAWGGYKDDDGVEYSTSVPTTLTAVEGARETSYAVDTSKLDESISTLRLQSHSDIVVFCTGSFRSEGVLKGDANGDGKVDILDLIRVKKYLADNSIKIVFENADMNSDASLEGTEDLVLLKKALLGIVA